MKILVTGGAGFIGVHTCMRFAEKHEVMIIDDLSRAGTDKNLEWLQSQRDVQFKKIDIRDHENLEKAFSEFKPDAVYHLAGQVAVTFSVTDPRNDFEVNALGTFNVLEATRKHAPHALVAYTSTNKVYGSMEDVKVVLDGKKYQYDGLPGGVPESRSLDFHSPYGCSKGAADQYVVDYARIYDMNTVVFRQSCIYGTRQFGIEDQGWVAWFTIASQLNCPITIFGDGKQVRDVLWVDDLINLYEKAFEKRELLRGHAFNTGGGVDYQMSLLELVDYLEAEFGRKIDYATDDWRPGDQKVYISDITKAKKFFDWQPQVAPKQGVQLLRNWVAENEELFSHLKDEKKAA